MTQILELRSTYGLAGRTVVITGAARGQGAEETRLLVEAGARVIATDVLDALGEALVADLNGPGDAVYRNLDVTSERSWAALAAQLHSETQTVHGLVNNAGVADRHRLGEIDKMSWNQTIGVNLTGAMLGMQAIAPLMVGGSSIVNVGSVAGLVAHYGAAYTSSKWALRGLTKSAAVELGRRGIRVNIVHPGLVHTPLVAAATPEFVEAHLSLTPLGRAGTVGEIAHTVIFLLGEHASYITGAEIAVDGGFSAHGGAKVTSDAVRRSPG